jgi:hypothetical protein
VNDKLAFRLSHDIRSIDWMYGGLLWRWVDLGIEVHGQEFIDYGWLCMICH